MDNERENINLTKLLLFLVDNSNFRMKVFGVEWRERGKLNEEFKGFG